MDSTGFAVDSVLMFLGCALIAVTIIWFLAWLQERKKKKRTPFSVGDDFKNCATFRKLDSKIISKEAELHDERGGLTKR